MEIHLGIDISKQTFDAFVIGQPKTRHRTFQNNIAGFRQLEDWLKLSSGDLLHVCMEASGRYWELLAEYMHACGHKVSAVNPARIKGFQQSLLFRLKTDKADSEVIAQFCKALRPLAWRPPSRNFRALQELVRHSATIKRTVQQEKNRLQSGITTEALASLMNEHVIFLDEQLKKLEAEILDLIARAPELKKNCELLLSIPGVAMPTALAVLSEISDVNNFSNSKQLVAYAGLAPAERSSGTSLKRTTHISKIGNSRLRKALYFPAIVAKTYNPTISIFYQRLLAAGKKPMSCVVAAMRKLLQLIFGILKNQMPYSQALIT